MSLRQQSPPPRGGRAGPAEEEGGPAAAQHLRTPPGAFSPFALHSEAIQASTGGETELASRLTPSLSVLTSAVDCYATQIAIKSGIRQTVTQSVDNYIACSETVARETLAEQREKLNALTAERRKTAEARKWKPVKREAFQVKDDERGTSDSEGNGESCDDTSPVYNRKGKSPGYASVPLTHSGGDTVEYRATVMSPGDLQLAVGLEGVPMYMTWTYVRNNMNTNEEGRQMFYTDETGETVPASDSDEERPDFIQSCIVKTREDEAAIRGVMRTFGRSAAIVQELASQLEITPEEVRQMEKEIFREEKPAQIDRLGPCMTRMNNSFCRRCRIYGCKLHACGQQRPYITMAVATEDEEKPTPCGPKCWMLSAADCEPILWKWTDMEKDLIATGIQMYGRNACSVGRLLGKDSCRLVKDYLDARPGPPEGVSPLINLSTVPAEEPEKGPSKHQSRRKKSNKKKAHPIQVVKKRLQHDAEKAWPQYHPCNCIGKCDPERCPCALAGNFCEKFCGCCSSCPMRWAGCQCRSGCRNRACPCLAAGRECDPDLCKKCAPTCTGEAPEGHECCNMRLRLRQHSRIVMGLSSVAGWGAFLKQAAKKNDFLGEYTGEIVSQDEADRRGKVYDRVDNSYLFNLNKDSVLDARQFGNKLRFINHSKVNANCYAAILLVDGDHRVGIFAKQDIPPGVELFYDYRYDEELGPEWALGH